MPKKKSEPDPLFSAEPEGTLRVAGTRVTLDSIVTAYDNGASAEEIALRFPAVGLVAVFRTLAYCIEQREDVDAYLSRQTEIASDQKNAVRQTRNSSVLWRRLARQRRGAA